MKGIVSDYHDFAIDLLCLETMPQSANCIRALQIKPTAEALYKTSSACLAVIHNGWLEQSLPHVVVLVGGRFTCDGRLSNDVILYDHRNELASQLWSENSSYPATLLNKPGLNAAACVYIPADQTVYVYGGETSNGYSASLQRIQLGCNPGYESCAPAETDLSQGCRPCPLGTYSARAKKHCASCPDGLSTQKDGSKNLADCLVCIRCVASETCSSAVCLTFCGAETVKIVACVSWKLTIWVPVGHTAVARSRTTEIAARKALSQPCYQPFWYPFAFFPCFSLWPDTTGP